ncbi:MAG: NHLP leader peptide family natural product precursor [Richelia sp. RM2_1_2]|nr:NHLP leader peptide family natural product precursor [Richelia sp. SM1_7_0]NJN10447.1 NHLP leader peptide family natural product precursor [Richelia sp. RM1_1_1]NJO62789.1 NHLP leader peptide family natural product precursor [Richelia sp. RM2_1_2]
MSKQTPQTLEARIISRALEDPSFKQQLLNGSVAAKAAIEKEIGQQLPEDLQVNVLEETVNVSYIVLPAMALNQEMSQKELEAFAGGGTFGIVTFTPSVPCTMKSATFKL